MYDRRFSSRVEVGFAIGGGLLALWGALLYLTFLAKEQSQISVLLTMLMIGSGWALLSLQPVTLKNPWVTSATGMPMVILVVALALLPHGLADAEPWVWASFCFGAFMFTSYLPELFWFLRSLSND